MLEEGSRVADKPERRCSFCDKPERDVRSLIAGPSVFICNECIEACNEVIADETRLRTGRVKATLECAICQTPIDALEATFIARAGRTICPACVKAVKACSVEDS